MTPRFPVRVVTLAAALAVGGVEYWLGWRHQVDDLLLLPLAVATATLVVGAALMFDALLRRGARPDRDDVHEVIALQRRIDQRLDASDARLSHAERILRLAASEPALAAADRDLAQATERVERWESLAYDLPAWNAAFEAWSAAVSRIGPGLTPDTAMTSDDELRAARKRVPPTGNFSSTDLKAVTDYYVKTTRLSGARGRLDEYARATFETIGAIGPAPQPDDPSDETAA